MVCHEDTGLFSNHLILLDITTQMKNNCEILKPMTVQLAALSTCFLYFACNYSDIGLSSDTLNVYLFAGKHKT
jgi:hypothetical protein